MFEMIRNVIAAEVDMLKQGIGDPGIVQYRSTRMSPESSRKGSTTLVSDVKLCLRLPATPFRGPDADPFVPVLSSSFPLRWSCSGNLAQIPSRQRPASMEKLYFAKFT